MKDKPLRHKQSNLICGFKCKGPGCTEAYVGETKQSLKDGFSQHRRLSSSEYQVDFTIYKQSKRSVHFADTEDILTLDRKGR